VIERGEHVEGDGQDLEAEEDDDEVMATATSIVIRTLKPSITTAWAM
jgi:hypothetical protein